MIVNEGYNIVDSFDEQQKGEPNPRSFFLWLE